MTLASTILQLIMAFALILTATMRFATVGLLSTRRRVSSRKRRIRNLQYLRQAAEISRLNSELHASSGKSSALDWRVMEVAEIVDESEDCKSFYFVDPYGQPLPDFRPGQYLMVRPAIAGAYQTTRCYSLSSAPDSRYWRITVKKQQVETKDNRPGQSGGLSQWLHETIQVGDCLLIGGPSGHFFLPADNPRPIVLLAAGVGITPMASMLRWSLENTPDRPVALLYQVKDLEHWPLGERLHQWKQNFPNCFIHSFFSRASQAELQDKAAVCFGDFSLGKFDASDAVSYLDPKQCDFYMCGPDGWMDAHRKGLVAAGALPEHVHWESFGSATGAQPKEAEGSVESISVHFQHSAIETQWNQPEQTIWELAREHQVEIPSGCLSGVCGCCRVKLLAGEVEYDRPITIELAANECLTCISRPKSPIVIDA